MVDQELPVDKKVVNHSEDTTHTAYLWTVGGGILIPFQHKLSTGEATVSMLTN